MSIIVFRVLLLASGSPSTAFNHSRVLSSLAVFSSSLKLNLRTAPISWTRLTACSWTVLKAGYLLERMTASTSSTMAVVARKPSSGPARTNPQDASHFRYTAFSVSPKAVNICRASLTTALYSSNAVNVFTSCFANSAATVLTSAIACPGNERVGSCLTICTISPTEAPVSMRPVFRSLDNKVT